MKLAIVKTNFGRSTTLAVVHGRDYVALTRFLLSPIRSVRYLSGWREPQQPEPVNHRAMLDPTEKVILVGDKHYATESADGSLRYYLGKPMASVRQGPTGAEPWVHAHSETSSSPAL